MLSVLGFPFRILYLTMYLDLHEWGFALKYRFCERGFAYDFGLHERGFELYLRLDRGASKMEKTVFKRKIYNELPEWKENRSNIERKRELWIEQGKQV